MRILRVFPKTTKATPHDSMTVTGFPPFWHIPCDEVHISVTFTWHKEMAERMAIAWRNKYSIVKIGGPAYNDPGDVFTPGLYVKQGAVITSRGCIRKCGFCFVPKREGALRTLPIRDGYDVFDNNLLACPDKHVEQVFEMLSRQETKTRFTGGIDARELKTWHVKAFTELSLDILYTAYDHPSQQKKTFAAINMLRNAGLGQRQVGCYVLVGYDGDTIEDAERRLRTTFSCGAMPFAMFYRSENTMDSKKPKEWSRLVREWSRPGIIFAGQKQ